MKAKTFNQITMFLFSLMMLVVTGLASATTASAKEVMPPGATQKTVGFTLVVDFDRKFPKANTAFFFAYYDPEKGEWQKSSQRTDSSGRCSFLVPTDDQREGSYPFLYATEQDEMDKAIKEMSDGNRFALRIGSKELKDPEIIIDEMGKAYLAKGSLEAVYKLSRR